MLESDLFTLLLVLVEETLKEKGKRKKQISPELDEGTHLIARSQNLKEKGKRKKQISLELEEGTHVVAEPFCLICKTLVETL